MMITQKGAVRNERFAGPASGRSQQLVPLAACAARAPGAAGRARQPDTRRAGRRQHRQLRWILAVHLHGKAFDPFPYIALNLVLSALAGLQAPIIMMSQNRAAARDEILAQHHYEETQKIDQLLQANTNLTQQVHDLTEKVHRLTEQLCQTTS
ncbi:MAG TPA: DUF1003 domain-containing protein [Streptosporangiaceae bacterium]|nr:DUF1003 domain-containing protein [Streptosporangiaceae bacterium]